MPAIRQNKEILQVVQDGVGGCGQVRIVGDWIRMPKIYRSNSDGLPVLERGSWFRNRRAGGFDGICSAGAII